MAGVVPVGLGVVAAVFCVIVMGEVFYLVYWRKRPAANRRVTNIPVVSEGEAAVGVGDGGGEVAIDVTCARYQISALHQDLVEKLFPVLGLSTDSPQSLMGPPRMLFTITEETKEELEGLDLDGRGRSRRNSRSKSMSDISPSTLSPLSTAFATPLSSPDLFITPYGTPTYSPLLGLNRAVSSNPMPLKTSCRIMYDYSGSPPPAPPSPTRPSFPFLARPLSPPQPSLDNVSTTQDLFGWGSSDSMLSPNRNGPMYSPPHKPFMFPTSPIHSKQVECVVKPPSSLRNCKYVYENGTYSPSSPSSPKAFPTFPTSQMLLPRDHEIEEHNSAPSSPHHHHSADSRTPPSETVLSSNPDHSSSSSSSSSSFKPWSQRSSSALFSSGARPFRSPVLVDHYPPKSFLASGTLSPPSGSSPFTSRWTDNDVSNPFFLQSTSTVQ